jgi:hypothetical protein
VIAGDGPWRTLAGEFSRNTAKLRLEMPAKMRASAQLWLTYQHTLYKWFAIAGGPIEILTIVATVALAVRLRDTAAFCPL